MRSEPKATFFRAYLTDWCKKKGTAGAAPFSCQAFTKQREDVLCKPALPGERTGLLVFVSGKLICKLK